MDTFITIWFVAHRLSVLLASAGRMLSAVSRCSSAPPAPALLPAYVYFLVIPVAPPRSHILAALVGVTTSSFYPYVFRGVSFRARPLLNLLCQSILFILWLAGGLCAGTKGEDRHTEGSESIPPPGFHRLSFLIGSTVAIRKSSTPASLLRV